MGGRPRSNLFQWGHCRLRLQRSVPGLNTCLAFVYLQFTWNERCVWSFRESPYSVDFGERKVSCPTGRVGSGDLKIIGLLGSFIFCLTGLGGNMFLIFAVALALAVMLMCWHSPWWYLGWVVLLVMLELESLFFNLYSLYVVITIPLRKDKEEKTIAPERVSPRTIKTIKMFMDGRIK